MRLAVVFAAAAAVPAAAACDMHFDAEVGGALLPQANGIVPLGEGPTLVMRPGVAPAAIPPGPVKLAIDHAVPWTEVDAVLDRAEVSGAQPIFVVGQRQYHKGFVLTDRLALGPVLTVRARRGGKFCVSPPGTDEAYCLEAGDKQHISAVFVRGVIRQAVEEYGILQARVVPDPDVRWGDLVRTVDGVRTCCTHAMPVMVARPPREANLPN